MEMIKYDIRMAAWEAIQYCERLSGYGYPNTLPINNLQVNGIPVVNFQMVRAGDIITYWHFIDHPRTIIMGCSQGVRDDVALDDIARQFEPRQHEKGVQNGND